MKRVLILGITNLSNMGDNLIAESTDFLVDRVCKDSVVTHQECFLRWRRQKGFKRIGAFILTSTIVLAEKFRFFLLAEKAFCLLHKSYYVRILSNTDYAIMTSGMLKYSSQSHAYMYITLCRIVTSLKIPLLLNAKSIQKGDDSDIRFRRLVRALHSDYVYINTRDGNDGERLLLEDYGIESSYVGDPALWSKELFNIRRIRGNREEKRITVGVNLIRPNIFKDYGNNISSKQVVLFYNSLLKELSDRGISWGLFCDGMKEDYDLIHRLDPTVIQNNLSTRLTSKQDTSETLSRVIIPNTVEQFLYTVSSFDIIIGFRLHACISSVALDVPFVGMIWDNKSRFFAKSMGLDHFFLEPEELDVNSVLCLIKERLETPLNYSPKKELMNRCESAIASFLAH